jgi:hypothetical protein
VVNEYDAQDCGALEERTRALFEHSVADLDARTRSRLTQARYAALEELRWRRPRPARWLLAPSGGLLAAAILAVFLGGRPGSDPAVFEDLDVVTGPEDIELLQDVEFYAWLAQHPTAAQPGGG